jgi:hypothetical protein
MRYIIAAIILFLGLPLIHLLFTTLLFIIGNENDFVVLLRKNDIKVGSLFMWLTILYVVIMEVIRLDDEDDDNNNQRPVIF